VIRVAGLPARAGSQLPAEVLATARQIAQAERDQARKVQAGPTLRQQTAFGEYLARRAADPSYTFRRHLRQIGGTIEEQGNRDQ
jgi:4-hydroxy-4-methyl-2-oxoglutarate aldolase